MATLVAQQVARGRLDSGEVWAHGVKDVLFTKLGSWRAVGEGHRSKSA